MTQPLLSILIPTVVGREQILQRIGGKILSQVPDMGIWKQMDDIRFQWLPSEYCELITCKDNKELTIGEKREMLYNKANGLYSWQIDDDDSISDNAIQLILNAIKSNPEVSCITFREKCMMNGEYKSSNHSLKYSQWMDNQDGFSYVRSPFYKDVIRTDIAKTVPFPPIRYNEDEQWSMALYPHLKTEIHIDEELYYYQYTETNHNERYGIK